MEAWRPLGRILRAAGGPLGATHAMLPTPFVMADRIRVFFASCDGAMRGRVFFADFACEPPFSLMQTSSHPVLDVGGPDAFDRDGVNPSQVVRLDGRLALFYIGWRRGPPAAPYTLTAGTAFSDDDGLTFTKAPAPLLPLRPSESLFRTAPFLTSSGGRHTLLYIGGDRFTVDPSGKRLPVYSLMRLISSDPLCWMGAGETLLSPYRPSGEIGFGRPILTGPDDAPRLMLSIRTTQGYALVEAPFGDMTERPRFKPVLTHAPDPWEAGMQCFGAVCRCGAWELLFYNGDGFGRTGMGLAVRPAES